MGSQVRGLWVRGGVCWGAEPWDWGDAVCQGPREPTGFSWLIEGHNIKIPMFGIFLKDTVPDVE